PRRRGRAAADVGAVVRQSESRALQARRIRSLVRACLGAARRARTRSAVPPGAANRGGLHAVQDPRAPHPYRSGLPLGLRIPSAAVRRRVVAHDRRRSGAEAQTRVLTGLTMKKLLSLLLMAALASAASAKGGERKVLRLAFARAETSMDPARIVDLYSRNLTAHIF